MFQAVPPPIIRSTKLYIQRQLTIPDTVCTVLCSWWWAEEPPETRREIIEINRSRYRCILLVVLQRYTCDARTYERQISKVNPVYSFSPQSSLQLQSTIQSTASVHNPAYSFSPQSSLQLQSTIQSTASVHNPVYNFSPQSSLQLQIRHDFSLPPRCRWDLCPFGMVANYQSTLRNIPEERRSKLKIVFFRNLF